MVLLSPPLTTGERANARSIQHTLATFWLFMLSIIAQEHLLHKNTVPDFITGKFYNVVGQIGKPDCRGGDRRRKRERIEIERGRKSKKERHAPEGASRLKQVKMALQSVV